MKHFTALAFVLSVCLILVACGGRQPAQLLQETTVSVEVDQPDSTQAKPTMVQFPTRDPSGPDPLATKVSYQLYNLKQVETKEGWTYFQAFVRIQNTSSDFLLLNESPDEKEAGMVMYVLPSSETDNYIETEEGKNYPIQQHMDFDCETGEFQNWPSDFSGNWIPPKATLASTWTGCLGIFYRVPETLHPTQIVMANGVKEKQTFDVKTVPAAAEPVQNEFPEAVQLPATVKINQFEVTLLPDITTGGSRRFEIPSQIKNTDLAADGTWEGKFELRLFSKTGAEDEVTGLSAYEKPGKITRTEVIGPGQVKEGIYYFDVAQEEYLKGPYYLFYYLDGKWNIFVAQLPKPTSP